VSKEELDLIQKKREQLERSKEELKQ